MSRRKGKDAFELPDDAPTGNRSRKGGQSAVLDASMAAHEAAGVEPGTEFNEVAEAHGTVIAIDPSKTRMWRLHDRMDESVNEKTCAELIDSMRTKGQQIAAVGRRLTDDPDGFEVELFSGKRRRFSTDKLGVKLRVNVVEWTDRQAYDYMEAENDGRGAITTYERARSYVRAIDSGLFGTASDLADSREITRGTMSKHLAIGRLPPNFIRLLGGPEKAGGIVALLPWGQAYSRLGDKDKANFDTRCKNLVAAGRSRRDALKNLCPIIGVDNPYAAPKTNEGETYQIGKGRVSITEGKKGGHRISVSRECPPALLDEIRGLVEKHS